MKTNIPSFTRPSPLLIATIFATAALASIESVQASPDPPVSITNGVALFQGNQTNGIAGGVGKDFPLDKVTTLQVNSLSGAIQPANGVDGINFQKTGAGDVAINAGVAGSNIVINTTGAAGINAGSVGSPPSNPSPDPFWGVPIPAGSSAQGGVVQVQSYSDITNTGNNAAGILATSQTTGYPQTIIQGLTNLVNAGVTFTVVGVTNADGTNVAAGTAVTGTLVDSTGTNVIGTGGTFTISSTGTFSFDAGTNLSGLAVGESFQSLVNYTVQGVNQSGMTNDSMGTLLAVITMTTNGLVTRYGAYFDTYGPSTNENSALPDIGSYGQYLAGNASAGGAGNSVTVDNEGSIKTYGTNSSAIFAQSLGGNGGSGRGGSISHKAGQGGAGSSGGNVTVTANGSISTVSNYSAGVVAWSQGGTGGHGGNGGTWRYGARGGTGGDAGVVNVTGNGTIHTYGDYASGILAVSVGGDGGDGGNGGGVTGGGNGGFGGRGSNVVVNGNWNITTEGNNAYGIWAKSVGGNAGTGGSGGWLAGKPGSGGIATDGGTVTVNSGGTIETFGSNSYGIYAESVGGFGGRGGSQSGIFYSHGGSGESAGSGGNVYVTQEAGGQIITYGTNSHGIYAQSVGGGGGSGGSGGALVGYGGNSANGGFGGNVYVTNYGGITTFGSGAKGIYAQSVGGGGGDGGFGAGAGAVGGKGSGTSDGGKVSVFNAGTIDSQAEAIFAQSIGGGGGNGGSSSGWFSFGGSGGGGGNADSVEVVNIGNLTNHEDNASAIFAQSLGGGGGNGGCSVSAGAFGSLAVGGSGGKGGDGADVSVYSGTNIIDTSGTNSHGIFAQSVGGGGGNGGYAIAAAIGKGASVAVAVGGNGGSGGSASNVLVDSSSTITTRGTGSHGIFAQSVGGGGGTGGFSLALSGSDGVSLSLGIGGSGGGGGNGREVTVGNSGGIETLGDRSYGILAQSVGGGGGDGGFSISVAGSLGGLAVPLSFGGTGGTGGAGGLVFLTNSATIITHGSEAHGVIAQSVGGGGGSGGFSIAGAISTGNALSLSFGGSGGSGGAASNVTLVNSGTIATLGDRSYGVLAQSVGGGGGDGGFSVSGGITGGASVGFSMGGNGSSGGRGGNVYLENSGSVFTTGNDSHALIAQSIGGGGGNGGFSVAGGISKSPSVQIGIGGKGGSGANGGDVTLISDGPTNFTEGDRAYGIFAQSVGGGGGNGGFAVAGGITKEAAVSFAMGGDGSTGGMGGLVIVSNSSRIETEGDLAHGILAQSVGGGGGAGGFSMAGSLALSQESKQVSVAIGGDGGGGGSGSNVLVYNSGTIMTLGERANGIFAQSVGGGGGDGGEAKVMNKSLGMVFTNSGSAGTNDKGWSLSIAIGAGGKGGSAGNGGVVNVTNLGTIYTGGSNSIGIMAQSVGGGGGSGGLSATDASAGGGKTSVSLNFGLGGAGGGGGAGNAVNVVNQGTITTAGDASHGIFAQSVGGGGGLGGASTATTSSPDSDTSHSVTLTAVIGGTGGAGGNGSNVVVQQEGTITTYGEGAYGILAQSVGGGGGAGGTAKIEAEKDTNSLPLPAMAEAAAPAASTNSSEKSWSVDLSFGLGGKGGIAGDGGQVTVDNRGNITTYGENSVGIFAQSVGGGGGAGGMSQIEGRGDSGNTNMSLSISLGGGLGGAGGAGGAGNTVAVTNQGTIITTGNAAHGIFAQSVGGGGGLGGASAVSKSTPESGSSVTLSAAIGGGGGAGGNGGDVAVVQDGTITTYGEGAYGILAQSVGGGGGMGGTAKIETEQDTNSTAQPAVGVVSSETSTNSNEKEWSVDLSFGLGGSGGIAGNGGQVTVDNRGSITNYGANSIGIFAQSVGGGGGAGGMSQIENTADGKSTNLSLSINLGGGLGGSGGAGGNGDVVRVTSEGSIATFGDAGYGIVAQSIGGGGGNGGASAASTATAGDKSVNLTATIGGSGGAAGDGGAVIVDNQGEINTWGDGAYGILAQSVGGGGGNGGIAKIETQQDNTNSTQSYPSQGSDTNPPSWSVNLGVGVGGKGGSGGDGGTVTVNNASNITTRGASAIGIFAQSVGGGGGSGGMSSVNNGGSDANIAIDLGLSLGGSGTNGGSGDTVTVTNTGTIITLGDNSHAIFAQSVGGGGGLGGDSAMTSAAPGTNLQRSVNLSLSLGGSGSLGGNAGAVNVVQNGQIYTVGANSYGILAQSIGGGGGAGGASASTPSGGISNMFNLAVEVGGKGGPGGYAGAVNVLSSGGITTYGDDSYAILAQSIGGGGGVGGNSVTAAGSDSSLELSVGIGGAGGNGNYGGAVTVTNNGDINTWGNNALGILAQSIGGGGGRGGNATMETNLTGGGNSLKLDVSVGGSGAGASDGGAVTVDNIGNIATAGVASHGIMAQSIGGGGGGGGYGGQSASADGWSSADLHIVVGGKGGSSGNGGSVTVNNSGYILTTGAGSFGVLAQSVGGGGGIGGYGQPGASLNVALGGSGGAGGNGGDVNVKVTGTIETFGDGAYGVLAQSIGGGGGIAGNVNEGITSAGLSLNLGQSGGAGGNGGDVTVVSAGNIITHGTGADGIFAQSVGGGGGLAGNMGDGLSFAGSVGGAGSGGDVHITHTGNISIYGDNAYGIFAQSAGGTNTGGSVKIDYIGSINVYGSNSSAVYVQSRGDQGANNMTLTVQNGSFVGGIGNSAGVWFADGGNNTLQNYNTITTMNGISGNAIVGGTGNETINNDGIIIGSVDLGGGQNQFNNYSGGRLNAGSIINLGAGNLFLNNGTLAPGGPGVLQRTTLTGNLMQVSNGVVEVELGSAGNDLLAVNGTASLDGTLSVARLGNFIPTKGQQFTILTAAGGVTNKFATLDDLLQGNFALHMGILYDVPDQVNLITLQDSFVRFATTPNQRAVAQALDTFSGFQSTNQLQGDPRETNLITTLNAVPGPQLPADFNLIAPEELGALYDMQFGGVNSIVGNVQNRMNDLRNGFAVHNGSLSLYEPGGPVMQLASAGRSLPPMTKAGPDNDWNAFVNGYGQFVHVGSTANAPGYCLQNSGFVLDFDKPLDTGLMGGFTVDYAGGEASLANGGSANMEGGRAGAYGTWFNTNAYLEAQVGAGGARYDSKRAALGGFANGSTRGFEIDTMFGGGYDLKRNHFTSGIMAEMHYTYVDIEGFTETGSMAPLQIMENDSHSLWTLLGWRLAYDWRFKKAILRPELRLGWRHEFMDTAQTIKSQMASGAGTVFQVESPSVGRDSLSIVAGLSTRLSQRFSIFAYYDGELARNNASSHSVNGGLSWTF